MFDGAGVLTIVSLFGAFPLIPGQPERFLEVGVDRLAPTKDDRPLDTLNLQAFLFEKRYAPLRLQLRVGATVTRVTGHIVQLEGSFEEGTLREVRLDSPAWGLGPVAEARFDVWHAGPLELAIDVSTGVMLYDRSFPAGGEHYNGMFQAGPTVRYALGNDYDLSIGYRWMHVSNGRGLGPRNPAYEAKGFALRISRNVDWRGGS